MRQAGRYLPEYRQTRKRAGGFLDLCYNSDLSTEVTLQPIQRYNFDAAILFADILLVPQALGMDLTFEAGEGPRLYSVIDGFKIKNLKPVDEIHSTLSPIYQTVKNLSSELPKETALIGFAGAPWTVATYMVLGKGSKDHIEVKRFINEYPTDFSILINILTEATIEYLSAQINAGAEVVKIFDSWAGSLSGNDMLNFSYKPIVKIAKELRNRFPEIPIIAFPRGVGGGYVLFSEIEYLSGLAIDSAVPAPWASTLQKNITVQGNLDPLLLVTGGNKLKTEVKYLLDCFSQKPYIFNLGHGITPDADPKNVDLLIEYVRST
jgi:uroporphyrinogen decarboxylase